MKPIWCVYGLLDIAGVFEFTMRLDYILSVEFVDSWSLFGVFTDCLILLVCFEFATCLDTIDPFWCVYGLLNIAGVLNLQRVWTMSYVLSFWTVGAYLMCLRIA